MKESIFSVIYVLRKLWKCFEHQETFSLEDVKDPSSVAPNQFWPKIHFVGMYVRPERYPTRDICPVQDPVIARELDARLDVLIQSKIHIFYR